MNAYTHKMNEELLHFYKGVNDNDDVRVIIVTGSGRAFCAGMDLTEGGSTFDSNESAEEYRDLGGQVSLAVYEVNKPNHRGNQRACGWYWNDDDFADGHSNCEAGCENWICIRSTWNRSRG